MAGRTEIRDRFCDNTEEMNGGSQEGIGEEKKKDLAGITTSEQR